jgi:Tfp pilus assembly protein PilN
MANINLISAKRAERVRMNKVARGLLAGVVATAVLSAGTVTFMLTRMVFAGRQLAEANSRMEQLRPVLQEIEDAERERNAVQPKLKTLTEAQERTTRWYGVMDGLKRVVPQQTWLTNIAVEKQGDAGSMVRVNGITSNQSRVGETMYRLTQQAEFYKKVDLRYTRTTTVEDQENVEFELVAQLNQPELVAKAGGENAPQAK